MKRRSCHFGTPPLSAAKRFLRDQEGGAAAEYALLIALAGVAVTVAALRLSDAVSGSLSANGAAVAAANASTGSGSTKPLTSAAATAVHSIPSQAAYPPPAQEENTNQRDDAD